MELFRTAVNWKNTLRRHIQPFLVGDVLEVGAGIGGTTQVLRSGTESSWTCLEPDPSQAEIIRQSDQPVAVKVGTIAELGSGDLFDTIIYIDVLEHIEDDRAEIIQASQLLKPGGRIVILGPAHQFLYSRFDQAIGHFRRYDKRTLAALRVSELSEVCSRYLDSVGLLASAANKLWLSQALPSARQIAFWDKCLVSLSRLIDPVFGYTLGKSVLAVWQKDGSAARNG